MLQLSEGVKPWRFFFLLSSAISAPELRVVVRNSSMFTVAWDPPGFGEDSVVEYHLSYSQPQKREQGPFIVGKQQREYSLYGLGK